MVDELKEFKESMSNWVDEKINNPLIVSSIAVWIGINKKLVFAIFNFDSGQSLQSKIQFIDKYFDQFDINIPSCGIAWGGGFYMVIIYSIVLGYALMVFMNFLNYSGKFVYKKVSDQTKSMQAKWDPTNWYPKSKWDSVNSDKRKLSSELEELQNRYDKMQSKVNSHDSEMAERDSTISSLQTRIENLQANQKKFQNPSTLFGDQDWVNIHKLSGKSSSNEEPFRVDGDNYILKGDDEPTFKLEDVRVADKYVTFIKRAAKKGDNRATINHLILFPDNSLRGVETNLGDPNHEGNDVVYKPKKGIIYI